MTDVNQLITEHLDIWTSATEKKSRSGRGKSGTISFYGVKKLRELLLELAVTGRLVSQDPEEGTGHKLKEELKRRREEQNKKNPKRRQVKVSTEKTETFPAALPASWSQVRLSEVSSKIGAGSTPRGGQKSYVEQGICFLRSQNVWNSGLRLDGVAKIPNTTHERMSGTHVFAGDILFNITGASIARTTLVQDDFETGNVSQHVAIIRPTSTKIRQFLHLVLMSPFSYKRVMEVQVGVSREGLSIAKLGNFPIPLPPIAEQHRIVAKVDELMGLCDALEAQAEDSLKAHQILVETCLATLTNSKNPEDLTQNWTRIADHFDTLFTTEESIKVLKNTILSLGLKGLLERQLRISESDGGALKRIQNWRENAIKRKTIRAPRKMLSKIEQSELPSIKPCGWVWSRLGNIIYIKSGDGLTSKNMKDGGIPVYGGNGITGYHDSANINHRTIVIGRVGYYCGSVHITPESAWITDNAFETNFDQTEINLEFLALLLTGTDLKKDENATAQPVISGSKIYPIVVGLPPLEEQHRIVKKVHQLFNLSDTLLASIPKKTAIARQLADTLTSKIH